MVRETIEVSHHQFLEPQLHYDPYLKRYPILVFWKCHVQWALIHHGSGWLHLTIFYVYLSQWEAGFHALLLITLISKLTESVARWHN